MARSDLVVRFAGEGGQGLLSTATGLATAFTQVGYHSQTFATFPSQIVGGPTWMQARISNKEIVTMPSTDIIIPAEKDNVGVVVVEKITQNQECNSYRWCKGRINARKSS